MKKINANDKNSIDDSCNVSSVMDDSFKSALSSCTLCPRNCGADRLAGKTGVCGQTAVIRAARAALHFWEEPVLSGTNGSGAVFFSGCNLRCVFCQNYNIALGETGKEISPERLCEIYFELKEKGAHNINLVTGTPYIPLIAASIIDAKVQGLNLPFIFNCGGYENVDALKMLDGLIDIYLPDMKYFSSELSSRYSKAPDYFEKASLAIEEMYRQVRKPEFVSLDSCEDKSKVQGREASYNEPLLLMKKGLIVRHLILPGCTKDSKKILRYLYEKYGDNIYISIMNQYTPLEHITNGFDSDGNLLYPELTRKVTAEEYDRVVDFAIKLGIENAFIQEGDTAKESFIPAFDYEGI